jgi:hypothetical protein
MRQLMRRLPLIATILLASAAFMCVSVTLCGSADARAKARPRVVKLACVFGDGRTHLLAPRDTEADSDDPLICQLELAGVSEADAAGLVGELRVVQGKQERLLATVDLEPREDRYRRAVVELVAAHDSWFESIEWAPGRAPKVHLVVAVVQRSETLPRESWKPVLSSRLAMGHRRVHAGTPSFKSSVPVRPPSQVLRPPVALSRAARRTPPPAARAATTPTAVAPAGDPYAGTP